MDSVYPFSITATEKQEIRQVAKLLFWGGTPAEQPETAELYFKWKTFFDVFLQIVDRRTGSFLHLPFNCSPMFLPAKTMSVFTAIQEVFFQRLEEAFKGK